jgi:uracil-DNA glycosylase
MDANRKSNVTIRSTEISACAADWVRASCEVRARLVLALGRSAQPTLIAPTNGYLCA